MALAVANYIAAKEKETVAYVEVGEGSQIKALMTEALEVSDGKLTFTRHKVCYYPARSIEEAEQIGKGKDTYIVYDIQSYNIETHALLVHCAKAVLLGSLKPWNYRKYWTCIRDTIITNRDIDRISYYSFGLTKQEKSKFQQEFHQEIQAVPYIPDPFALEEESFAFLKQICYGSCNSNSSTTVKSILRRSQCLRTYY